MPNLDAQFDKAVSIVQGLPKDGPIQPSNEDKLDFYGYYKQVTVGDVEGSRPGMFDFVGKAKWDAWNAQTKAALPKETLKQKYVDKLVDMLKEAKDSASEAYLKELEAADATA